MFFRSQVRVPSLFALSEPLSRFQSYKGYAVPIDEERKYYSNIGLVPAYFANMNRVVCFNLWGEQARDYFAPYSRPLQPENESVWRLDPTQTGSVEISSMNFVLGGRAQQTETSETMKKIVSDYLKFGFWCDPSPGFGSCAHIMHSRDSISQVLKAAKGIYILEEIRPPRLENLSPYCRTWVQRVDLEAVNGDRLVPLQTYIAKDVIEKAKATVTTDPFQSRPINGLIYELKDKVDHPFGPLRLLSVISDFLSADLDLFMTMISHSTVNRFWSSRDSYGRAGSIQDIKTDVARTYRTITRRVNLESSLFDSLQDPFSYAIAELFPILIQHEQQVYFIHPMIVCSLLQLGLEDTLERRDPRPLLNFVSLLERTRRESQITQLRLSGEGTYFKKIGVDFAQILPILNPIACGIQVSRLMHEFF